MKDDPATRPALPGRVRERNKRVLAAALLAAVAIWSLGRSIRVLLDELNEANEDYACANAAADAYAERLDQVIEELAGHREQARR